MSINICALGEGVDLGYVSGRRRWWWIDGLKLGMRVGLVLVVERLEGAGACGDVLVVVEWIGKTIVIVISNRRLGMSDCMSLLESVQPPRLICLSLLCLRIHIYALPRAKLKFVELLLDEVFVIHLPLCRFFRLEFEKLMLSKLLASIFLGRPSASLASRLPMVLIGRVVRHTDSSLKLFQSPCCNFWICACFGWHVGQFLFTFKEPILMNQVIEGFPLCFVVL